VAIIAAALLQGILAALVVLPVLATVGIMGRYIRARLLNLDPWSDENAAPEALYDQELPVHSTKEDATANDVVDETEAANHGVSSN
jgi:hypothetical protein